jgi:hypothetical protein
LKRPIAQVGLYHPFTDYNSETQEDIIAYLPEHATDILEAGCGRGHTGALIQKRLNCRVTGKVRTEARARLLLSVETIPQRTELPERFAQLPAEWHVDRDSLSTTGFWVVIHG